MIAWPAIGTPTEIVVAVSRVGAGGPAAGTISLDASFDRAGWLATVLASLWGSLGGVLLAGMLAALFAFAPAILRGRVALATPVTHPDPNAQCPQSPGVATPGLAARFALKRDFVCGAAAVFIAALTIAVYWLGDRSRLEAGTMALGAALAGAAIAEWLKFGLTGRHLTPREILQDVLASGLLAACSSPLAILQCRAIGRKWCC